ncbi:hypothetical protein AAMO2058_000000500 [Amorphochlora amoebiformis]
MSYTSDDEIPLASFATYIESKNVNEIRSLFKANRKFKGFTVMMIAAMHTQGTWVLTQFGQEDKSKVDEKSDQELKDLAATLHLDVDDEILNDKGFTPLMLAVMFGPPASVKALIDAGAAKHVHTDRGFSAKMFATCRDDPEIRQYFARKREICDPYWEACSMM